MNKVVSLQQNNFTDNEKIDNGILYYTPYNVSREKMNLDKLKSFISGVSALPPKLKSIMTDFSTAEYIYEKLGSSFNLSANQKSGVTEIIRDVIAADLFIGDMPAQIAARLNVDAVKAKEVSNTIINQLLKPALAELKQVQKEKYGQKINELGTPAGSGQSRGPEPQSPRKGAIDRTINLNEQRRYPSSPTPLGPSQPVRTQPPKSPAKSGAGERAQDKPPGGASAYSGPSAGEQNGPSDNQNHPTQNNKGKKYNVINLKDL